VAKKGNVVSKPDLRWCCFAPEYGTRTFTPRVVVPGNIFMPFRDPANRSAPSDENSPWYGALEFRTLAENVPALLFVSNRAGMVIYTNSTYQRYVGASADGLLGLGYLDSLHPEDRVRAGELWARINQSTEAYEIEHRLRRDDGEYRWHHVRGAPILDTQGEVVRWIGICTDIQDLRSALAHAHDSTELLAVIGQSTDALVFAKDAEGRFVFANDATLDALKVSAHDVLGHSFKGTGKNATEVASIDANDQRVMNERKMLVLEETWTTSAGVKRTYRSTKGPWLRADGCVGIVGITTDITREKDLTDALAEQKHAMRNLTESLPFVLWLTDVEGKLIVRNNVWQSYAGMPETTDDPLTFADLIDPIDYDDFMGRWTCCLENSDILDTHVLLHDRIAGQSIKHHIVAIPVRDRGGRLTGWVGSAVPILEQIS
jgi:PAS domain S-box-containing protein